jgi:UDP-N-acetylglucosamine 2-epimerase (non-hydrolysing)
MIRGFPVFGIQSEAIKMAQVVKEQEKHPQLFTSRVCVLAQYRQMPGQLLCT